MNFIKYFEDLLWLVYPSLCAACDKPLYYGENCICTHCRFHLPKTGFHTSPDNPIARHFWGKVNIESATAYYYFSKGEKIQNLIHHLKYKGRRDVGHFIGELLGYDLIQSGLYSDLDAIVPVPLHVFVIYFCGGEPEQLHQDLNIIRIGSNHIPIILQ